MKDPLPIIIYGNREDAQVIALKCLLLKCGVTNFRDGRPGAGRRDGGERVGLFIVAGASLNPDEVEGISTEARRLAVPVLRL